MKTSFVAFLLSVALTGCSAIDDGCVIEGECPAISRDGTKLAFQRVEGTRMHLGVIDLGSGEVEWIVRGETAATAKENACQPAWGPDGSLVFAYANLTNTAYQRFSSKGPKDGYRLRLWKNGQATDLVGGFARNYSPSFTPDGRSVYFCRQTASFHGIATVDVADPKSPKELIAAPPYDSGLSQPVVSPDGRFLAYAELGRRTWGLKLVRLSDPEEQRSVTPGAQSAYSPNWTPDGLHLVYTGFEKGDPCWGVYIVNLSDRSWKRLCDGTDPCVSPDGRWIYYAKDGKVRRRPLAPVDYPVAAVKPSNPRAEKEKVVFTLPEVATKRVSKGFSFPTEGLASNVTYFARFKVDWDGRKSNHFLFSGGLEGAGSFWVFVIGESFSFHGCEVESTCVASSGRKIEAGTHTVTVVHGADGVIYGSADGGPWTARSGAFATGPVNGKGSFSTFPNGTPDDKVRVYDVEFGLGWPKRSKPH